MLIYAYWLLKYDTEYVLRIRQKYQYTNSLQRDLIYFIAGEDGSLAVVEDDDQSIYEFHGARTEVMLQFEAHYPNANVIRMSTSYRFCKGMIQLIDHLIWQNTSRFAKNFWHFIPKKGRLNNISILYCTNHHTEEHRLFYVAMTRAKENLYLCNYEKRKDQVKPLPYLC